MAARIKRVKVEAEQNVPQTAGQVVEAIAEIGQAQRERERIQAAMNDQLAEIRQRYEAMAKPHAERIVQLTEGVHTYCEAHRAELTRDGKVKYYAFASGEVKWRTRPPSVAVRGEADVLAALKNLNLSRFIRTKEEINKEQVLAEPEAITGVKGLTIKQGEDFVIEPFETKLEQVA